MGTTSKISYSGLRTCRYLLKLSYIGTRYKGVQRLTKRINEFAHNEEDGSIQCAIENALNRALCPAYGARLALSSRTDSGVHAYQNYANVDLTHPLAETLYRPSFITDATNRVLEANGHEISIVESQLVPSYFHSRINAKWRAYAYRLAMVNSIYDDGTNDGRNLRSMLPVSQINRCHIIKKLDLNLVQQCIEMFRGEHDFTSFATKDSDGRRDADSIKNIEALQLHRCQPLTHFELVNISNSPTTTNGNVVEFYELYIKSKSFLYNQVRRMVSALIDVGIGKMTLDDIEQMLNKPNHRPKGMSPMVPACGLYLVEVGYDKNDMLLRDDDFMDYSPKAYFLKDSFNDGDDNNNSNNDNDDGDDDGGGNGDDEVEIVQ